MPVQKVELHVPGQGTIHVPACQFEINPKQQVAVVGLTYAEEVTGFAAIADERTQVEFIGKLDEQSFVFMKQMENSLIAEGWDFLRFPNPRLFLLQKKDDSKIIINSN